MDQKTLYSTNQAAQYLDVAVATVKYHVYTIKDLQPDGKIGGHLFFTKETLDAFKDNRTPPGRPPKKEPVAETVPA